MWRVKYYTEDTSEANFYDNVEASSRKEAMDFVRGQFKFYVMVVDAVERFSCHNPMCTAEVNGPRTYCDKCEELQMEERQGYAE